MNIRKLSAALLSISAISLLSCSGAKTSPGGGGGSTATVSLTLTATPLTPPPNTNLLSFIVDVNTITLTSSTGTNVNIPLNATNFSVDLTKLQSDSAFLGTSTTVPPDTYASITLSLSNALVTFCTQTQGTTGCAAGSITTISGSAAATPKITSAPFPLTLTANQKTGLAINFNLANALTVSATQPQVVTAVSLAAANVLSAKNLPPTPSSLATGQLDFVEDVTGVVTAVNTTTQSVTVKTATRGSITAVANSSTVFSPNCTAFLFSLAFSSCVVAGQVASIDTVLNSDGTFTLLEYDPLATTTGDWIEGIVPLISSSSTQFTVVTNDLVLASSGSLISPNLPSGARVNATLVNAKPFLVDSKGLTIPTNSFAGSTDASIFLPGQTLSLHVTAFTPATGSTPATVSVDTVYLRFTRVSGTVASTGTQASFTIQNLPPFFGMTTPLLVEVTQGAPPSIPATNFDGVSSAAALSNPQTVSIRALYFGGGTQSPSAMPFSAAKVRVP
jgi:hypothetical protein